MKRMMVAMSLIGLLMFPGVLHAQTETPTPAPTATATPSPTPTPTPELNVLVTLDPPGIDPREAVVTLIIRADQVAISVLSFFNLLALLNIAGIVSRE